MEKINRNYRKLALGNSLKIHRSRELQSADNQLNHAEQEFELGR